MVSYPLAFIFGSRTRRLLKGFADMLSCPSAVFCKQGPERREPALTCYKACPAGLLVVLFVINACMLTEGSLTSSYGEGWGGERGGGMRAGWLLATGMVGTDIKAGHWQLTSRSK